MLGGDWYEEIKCHESNPDKLIEKCLQVCAKYLQINQHPINVNVTFNKVSKSISRILLKFYFQLIFF